MNIEEINRKHFMETDMYYRVGYGLSSKLINYSCGIFTLEVVLSKKWAKDYSPIDEKSISPLSQHHSKSYLRHLFQAKEYLAAQIASIHNLSFYLWLVMEAKKQITAGSFYTWKNDMVKKLQQNL